MSEWTLERAAAAFPVGGKVLIRGIEVGRVAAVKRLNGDGDPLVQLSDTIWYRPCDLTPLPDPALKVWSVSLSACDGHEALGKVMNWGTVGWLVLAHDMEAAAAIALECVGRLHPEWPQDEVAAGLRVDGKPWGDTSDLSRPRVLVGWIE